MTPEHGAKDRVERSRGDESLVDSVLNGARELADAFVGERRQAELLEVDPGEVEDLSAAAFFVAEDLRVALGPVTVRPTIGSANRWPLLHSPVCRDQQEHRSFQLFG